MTTNEIHFSVCLVWDTLFYFYQSGGSIAWKKQREYLVFSSLSSMFGIGILEYIVNAATRLFQNVFICLFLRKFILTYNLSYPIVKFFLHSCNINVWKNIISAIFIISIHLKFRNCTLLPCFCLHYPFFALKRRVLHHIFPIFSF